MKPIDLNFSVENKTLSLDYLDRLIYQKQKNKINIYIQYILYVCKYIYLHIETNIED